MSVAVGAGALIQPMVVLGLETTIEWSRTAMIAIFGYGLLAGICACAVAFGYRAVTVRTLPIGLAALTGLSVPAGWLTIEAVRHGRVIADTPLSAHPTGLYLGGVVIVGATCCAVGHRVGDDLACGAFDIEPIEARGPVATLLQAGGLAVAVVLPASIDDATGYPAVEDSVKRDLADRTVLLPSGLEPSTLRDRLERRLETDYQLGYVHVELRGTDVTGLTIGGRRTGLSPTLGPDRVAVAITADAPARASTGDRVEIWTDETPSRFVTTGTVRGRSGSTTTIVVAADDAEAFDADARYRLTTRPETPSATSALVSAIRATTETVTVVDGGPHLESEFVGWLPGTVLAIDRDEEVLALPADGIPLKAEDTVYLFGTPETVSRSTASLAGPDRSSAR